MRRRNGKRKVSRAVKNYIKKAVKGSAETKVVSAFQDYQRLGQGQTYVFCPSWQITQGIGSGQRVGRKISNAYVKLNCVYTHNGENDIFVNIAQSSFIRMLVLRSRAIKTAGVVSQSLQVDPGNLTAANVFFYTATSKSFFSDVDKRTWTVKKDVTWRSSQIDNNGAADMTAQVTRKKFIIPLGKKCTFISGDSNGYFVGPETYIVFVAGWSGTIAGADAAGDNSSNVGTLNVTGQIYFKDA